MVKRIIKDYKRKERVRKPIILIGSEGKNKTERIYVNNFKRRDSYYNIVISDGNSTDPVGIVKDTINTMKKKDISPKNNDKIYCLIDTDTEEFKINKIKEAEILAKNYGIDLILSSPCFEIWIYNHFTYTTKKFTNKELIKALKKYIPDYQKNKNVYEIIYPLTDNAIINSKKQIKNKNSNSYTLMYKLITELKKITEKNQ